MASELTDEEWEAPLDPELEAQIDVALANARDWYDWEVATSASFDVHHRLLLVQLKTGQRLAIPQEDLQEIAGANPADLTEIELLGGGSALHFQKIMEGVEVDALRRGVLGSQRWMDGLAERRKERLVKAS
jgi:hypothetical protein